MNDSDKTPLPDEVLLKAAKSTLDDSTALLDGEVRQRLQQARQAAVSTANATPKFAGTSIMRPGWMVTAGSFAMLAIVIGVGFINFTTELEPSVPMASIEDMPILTAPEELELYEELDFYQWLAEEQDSVG